MGTKQYLEIKNVEIVPGKELSTHWNINMQMIITDKNKYIDKLPENGGYDWKKRIGKTVNCYITESKGYKWIRPLKKEMKSEFYLEKVNTSKAEVIGVKRMDDNKKYLINSVEIVPGNLIKENWKDDMQKIETDKGVFIDNLPENGGYDWRKEKGKFVFAKENTSQNCRYTWLKLENVNKAEVKDSSFTKGQTIELVEELPPNYNINDNPELVEAYKAIKQNVPVIFLTGGAGTGKSTFIKFLKNNLKKETGKNCIVLAPTGIAAINVGGMTIHKFFNFPFDPFHDEKVIPSIRKNPVVDYTDLIIIDEISMVRSCMLDHIDYALRLWCDNEKPFGGKQLLLIGDCFQLPPVRSEDDKKKTEKERDEMKVFFRKWESPFFFAANSLKNINMTAVQLKKIYRQQNEQYFIHMLNRIRMKESGYERDIDFLNKHCFVNNRLGAIPEECPLLDTTNDKADDDNIKKINELISKGSEKKVYKAKKEYVDISKFNSKKFLSDEELTLCIGAKVMVTKNINVNEQNLINGDIGKVIGLGGNGSSNSDYVDVEIKKNKYRLTRQTWQDFEYSAKTGKQEIIGTYNQIPLMLGWAVTIHKSQGLTLDSVAIDAPDAWEPGQIYVALSRARSLNGIFLKKEIPVSAVKVDEYVIKKYEELFPESNEENFYDANEYKNIVLDNSGFTVDSTEEKSIVEIGGIDFNLYPTEKNGKHVWRDFIQKTMSILLGKKLIPDKEINKLLYDSNYCAEIFGINWEGYKYVLLKQNRSECYDSGQSRYWKENCAGYYICSQWTIKNAEKFASWLINLSTGNLSDLATTSDLEGSVNWAKIKQEEKEKRFKELFKSQEEDKREKEIQKAEVTKKRIVQNACNRMATRGGSVVGSGSSANKKQEIQDKPNDTILAEVIVKREDSKNGYYYFQSVSDEKELIARKDGKRKLDGVPDLYTKIKLIIYEYEQDGDIIKKWSWKRV